MLPTGNAYLTLAIFDVIFIISLNQKLHCLESYNREIWLPYLPQRDFGAAE